MEASENSDGSKRGRNETLDQRMCRLARQREYNKKRRVQTSTQAADDEAQSRMLSETDEQYQRRLRDQRDYAKRKRGNESAQPSTNNVESDEQYQRRLARQREHQHQYAQRKRADLCVP
jgi:hypothetical protein